MPPPGIWENSPKHKIQFLFLQVLLKFCVPEIHQYNYYCYALPTIAVGVYLSARSKLLQHPEPLATTTHSL